jgi:hypothetical protein
LVLVSSMSTASLPSASSPRYSGSSLMVTSLPMGPVWLSLLMVLSTSGAGWPSSVTLKRVPIAGAWKSSTNNCSTAPFTTTPAGSNSMVRGCGIFSGR